MGFLSYLAFALAVFALLGHLRPVKKFFSDDPYYTIRGWEDLMDDAKEKARYCLTGRPFGEGTIHSPWAKETSALMDKYHRLQRSDPTRFKWILDVAWMIEKANVD